MNLLSVPGNIFAEIKVVKMTSEYKLWLARIDSSVYKVIFVLSSMICFILECS